MGVTELVFQLNYFKRKISAILKRHCCHEHCQNIERCQNIVAMLYREHTFIVLRWVITVQKYISKLHINQYLKNCKEPP